MADVFYATENQRTTEEINESNVFYATEKQRGIFESGKSYPGTFDDNYSTYDYNETQSVQSNISQDSDGTEMIDALFYIAIVLFIIALALSMVLLFSKRKPKSSKSKTNTENTEKSYKIKFKFHKLSKRKLIALCLVVLLLFISLFTNYQKMPNKAKGELGTYLAKNLPNYASMQNIYYTIDFNAKGFKVTLGGNVKSNNKQSVTLYSEIQFNHLMLNPKIKKTKINNKNFTKENIKEYSSSYWWYDY